MELPPGKLIILFDGECNLCNGAVRFAISHDRRDRFRMAALQSEVGQRMVRERHIDTSKTDSIVLIDPGVAYYTESDAALKIGRQFGGGWKLLALFEGIPKGLRDPVYRWVAKYRYKWFGKKETCMVPGQELKSKFL
jgi:predicted DCC family thiol-disulfide oxidoreductase YuxK